MAKKHMLTKDAFLKNISLRKVVCDLPEIGGSVTVRELSGRSLLAYNERIKKMGETTEIGETQSLDLMALLISLTVINDDGTLMFTEDEAKQLADGSLTTMLMLSQKAMEVSGINTEAIAEVTNKLKNARTSSSTPS